MLILFDLDDTLLNGVNDGFMPSYMKALTKWFPEIDPQIFLRNLRRAIDVMVTNQDFRQTLAQVFDSGFFEHNHLDREKTWDQFMTFYKQEYPGLQKYTQAVAGLPEMIGTLLQDNNDISIATNPVFPEIATRQRIEWAGLPAEKYKFGLISTFDQFHFAKPSLEYFVEIVARLGWQHPQIVMIGDDIKRDITPAEKLGLPTFWIQHDNENIDIPRNEMSSSGNILDVPAWIEKLKTKDWKINFGWKKWILPVLKTTPSAFEQIINNASQQLIDRKPEQDEWSVREILNHLRFADQKINIPRFNQFVEENDPFIAGIDNFSFETRYECGNESLDEIIRAFQQNRFELVQLVENLPDHVWERKGRHAVFGPFSVCDLVQFIAKHDRNHVRQAYSTLKSFQKQSST